MASASTAWPTRSEERRVGKEWRTRGVADQAEDGIRDLTVTGVQTCALPISVTVPKIWAETPLGEHIGTIWLRRAIELPAAAAGKPAQIRLGIVDDSDVTYINGVRINGMANKIGRASCRERVED